MHHPPRTAPPVDRVSRIYDQAARYGALSSEHGQVTITTRRDGEQLVVDLVDKEGRLELAPPRSGGSGPELAKLSIERQLGGSNEKEWHPEGLHVRLKVEVSRLSRQLRRPSGHQDDVFHRPATPRPIVLFAEFPHSASPQSTLAEVRAREPVPLSSLLSGFGTNLREAHHCSVYTTSSSMFDRMNPDMKGLSGPLRRLREGNVSDNNEPADLLATLLMAGGLPETAVAPIRSLDCRLMEADRRRAFRPEGHSANEFVVVLSGMLAKFRTDRAGSRQIIGVSLPHDVILPHTWIRLYGLQALVKSRLILVPKQSLDRAVRHSDDLRQYLWRAILRDEAINHERILNLARRDAASRVAHLFASFGKGAAWLNRTRDCRLPSSRLRASPGRRRSTSTASCATSKGLDT